VRLRKALNASNDDDRVRSGFSHEH
jgi:hypothetical protein